MCLVASWSWRGEVGLTLSWRGMEGMGFSWSERRIMDIPPLLTEEGAWAHYPLEQQIRART